MAEQLARIRLLSQSSTAWIATNPVLLKGEVGFSDLESAAPRMRVGDGLRAWNALPEMTLQGPPGPTGATGPAGATGAIGPTGAAGPAPNLAIGTVTTLPPGSAATVTISGTSPNYVINFGIPRGATGATGPSGTSTFSGCRVRASSIPDIAHNTTQTISWDQDVFDVTSWHVTPSPNITVPSGVGYICAIGVVQFADLHTSGNFVTVSIIVNGFVYAQVDIRTHALDRVGINDPYTINIATGPVPVSPGQTIQMQVAYQNFTDFGVLKMLPTHTFLAVWALQKS